MLQSSHEYATVLTWICNSPNMDMQQSSHGYATVLTWICNSPYMDMQQSSRGYATVLTWICNSPNKDMQQSVQPCCICNSPDSVICNSPCDGICNSHHMDRRGSYMCTWCLLCQLSASHAVCRRRHISHMQCEACYIFASEASHIRIGEAR